MDKATIKDVAKLSKTSVRTVSRVINNQPNVRDTTRKRVEQAIEELNFEANFLARWLQGQKTNQIIVFIDQRGGEYWGAYHNEVFQALHRIIKQYNYRLVISPSSPDSFADDDNDGFHLVRHKLCDGAIIFDPIINDERVRYLKEHNTPFVLIGDSEFDLNISYVGVDNFHIGYLGAASIHKKGYQSPVLFLGGTDSIVNKKRAQGFTHFFKEKDLDANVIFEITNLQVAYEKTKEILSLDEVDAFFVSGDERALSVYKAIQEKGLQVGKDIGVLGIDNLKMSSFFSPGLTTIAQPKQKIARSLIKLLMEQLNNEEFVTGKENYQASIIERESL